jgi:hypothetical protein
VTTLDEFRTSLQDFKDAGLASPEYLTPSYLEIVWLRTLPEDQFEPVYDVVSEFPCVVTHSSDLAVASQEYLRRLMAQAHRHFVRRFEANFVSALALRFWDPIIAAAMSGA